MSSIAWEDSYLGQIRTLVGGDRMLLFVGARCIARDDRGQVLLIRRSDNGHWALPAGAMELGESISDCAVREVLEETGLSVLGVTPIAVHSGPRYTGTNSWGHTYQVFSTIFRVDEWSGELVTVTDETIDAGFFAADGLPEPLSGSVGESLADLAEFERTGRFIAK